MCFLDLLTSEFRYNRAGCSQLKKEVALPQFDLSPQTKGAGTLLALKIRTS